MKPTHLLPLAATLLFLPGCASGPAGGASISAPNRLEATLTLARTVDPDYYYGVAFDDIPGDSQGPVGIEGNTPILNGVVGGSWRMLVLWHLNEFQIFRRSIPTDPASEVRVLASPFLGTPRASNNSVDFTLDLDAKLSDGTYFFTHTVGATPVLAVDRFDLNAVTTNTIIRNVADTRIKPVDTIGSATIATPVIDFQVNGTRIADITDDSDDERPGVDPSFISGSDQVNYGQMDLTDLRISIVRG